MKDTDRMVAWLREAMGAAETIAKAAAERAWSPHWEYDDCVHQIRDLNNCNELADIQLPEIGAFVEANDPAAVLRRIVADRKTLDDCDDILHDFVFGAFRKLAEDAIRNLAEGYGWTEGTT